jgi:PKD repeat protein
MKKFILGWVILTICNLTTTAQNISGIINHYAKVSAIDPCAAKLTVSDTVGFTAGMRVIIIQMNGASIKSSNNSSFGQVEDMAMAGKYEINEVNYVQSKTIYLRFALRNEYQTDAAIQIVTMPNYDNVTVSDTLKAKPWSGETGGIIAFSANTVTLNAPILATATGFRGGAAKGYDNCQAIEVYNSYFYELNATDRTNGAPKGEGVAAFIGDKECGRGPQATGGGGGNNHKAGGGGGAHMTAGGIGGQQKRVSNTRNCNGDHPGWGGLGVGGDDNSRLFFGGGGGAGHSKSGNIVSKGGNGGGLIFLTANSLVGNGKTIAANGESCVNSNSEGAGGGGAGGSVVFNVGQVVGTVTVEAKGGKGGDSGSGGDYDFGTGGGGGGGRILLKNTTNVVTSLVGGEPGRNAIQRSSMGAVKGENGISKTLNTPFVEATDSVHRALRIVEQPSNPQVCEFRTTTLSVLAKGMDLRYQWQYDKGDGQGFRNLEGDATFISVASPVLIINRVTTTLNPYLFQCVITTGCGDRQTVTSSQLGLNIIPAPIPLFTISPTFNTVTFFNGTANASRYIWEFGDGRTSTATNPVHTYQAQGSYNVVLKAINDCDTVVYSQPITLNQKPKAGFISTSNDYCVPAAVRFTSTASNNSTSHRWIFEGGEPAISSELNPVVTYAAAGIYPVTLIVSNTNGSDTLVRQSYIRTNSPPLTSFRREQVGNNPRVSFVNQTQFGSTYVWDFGDGTPISTDPNPQHIYANAGVYVVCLTASNACGSSTKCDTITLNSLPSATIAASKTNLCTGETVNFTGQNPTSVVSWQWTFEGGVANSLLIPNPSVRYNTEGTFTVKLKVSNAAGVFETERVGFIKVAKRPKSDFRIDSVKGSSAWFTNLSDSGVAGTSFLWQFYSGRTDTNFNPRPRQVVFPRNGNYNITLQAYTLQCSDVKQLPMTIFVVGTNDPNTEGGLSTYPNPTSGRILLNFDTTPDEDLNLTVVNGVGQVVRHQQLNRQTLQECDLTDLPAGMYLLHIKNNSMQERTWLQRRILKL